jgi:hypothetical protein
MSFSLYLELCMMPIEWQVTAFPNGLVSVKTIPDKRTLEAALNGRLSLRKMAFKLSEARSTMDKVHALGRGLQVPSRWDEQRSITSINISLRKYGPDLRTEHYNSIDTSKVYALKDALEDLSSAYAGKVDDLRLHLGRKTFDLIFSVMPEGGPKVTKLDLEIDSYVDLHPMSFWKFIPKFTAVRHLKFSGKTVAQREDTFETIFEYLPRLKTLSLSNTFWNEEVLLRSEAFASAFETHVQTGHFGAPKELSVVNTLAPMDCECLMRVMRASANIPTLTRLQVGFVGKYGDDRVGVLAADLRVKRPDLEVNVYR